MDLGSFNAIQTLKYKTKTNTYQQLLDAVETAFKEQDPLKLTDVFLTLRVVMQQIICQGGGNDYKIQHVNKKKLRKEGSLKSILMLRDLTKMRLQEWFQEEMESAGGTR